MGPVSLSGVIEVAPGAVEDVTFRARGAAPVERARRGPATLVLADGARVEIDTADAVLRGFDAEKSAPTWAEVESTDVGALFADVAPGPHVTVKLTRRAVPPGGRVTVWGAPTYADGGYRGGQSTPIRIAATSVEPVGFEARDAASKAKSKAGRAKRARRVAAILERAAAFPWRWPVQQALAAGMVGLAVWGAGLAAAAPKHADMDVGARAMQVALAALAVVVLVHAAWTRSDAPGGEYRKRLVAFERPKAMPSEGVTIAVLIVGGIGVFLGVLLHFPAARELVRTQNTEARDRTKSGKPGTRLTTHARIGGAVAAGSVAVIGAFAWTRRRRSARIGRVLLRSTAAPREGTWCVVEGVARGAGVFVELDVTTRKHGKGDRRNGTLAKLEAAPFEVETPSGRIDVQPHTCEFASTFRREDSAGNRWTERCTLEDGAVVRVAGRLRESGGKRSFVGTGPESLVVFGAGAAPSRALVVSQVLHVAANVALVATIAALVYAFVG